MALDRLRALVERLGERGARRNQFASHPDPLRALPGKHRDHAALAG
ncbi:hypothetical protein [Burkholderia glumae]|nr:hypothetical protein [Burkholderia glumae]